MEVLPEDYVIDVSLAENNSLCGICILADSSFDSWILGDVFMRGWYNIHDATNKRMGFVPFINSSKTAPVTANTTPSAIMPIISIDADSTILGIDTTVFLTTIGIVAVLSCAVIFIVIYCNKAHSPATSMRNIVNYSAAEDKKSTI